MLAFYKWDDARQDELLIVISLDPDNVQQGHVRLPWEAMELQGPTSPEIFDHMTQTKYHWGEEWNFVELNPSLPIHIFQLNRQ